MITSTANIVVFIIVDGKWCYISICGDDNTVSAIDGKTNTVVKTIPVGYNPWGIAINPDTNMIYVTNSDHDKTYIINGVTKSTTFNSSRLLKT